LPTGGGALRGIGETFMPDLHTGTGNYSVPIEVPGGRAGLQPSLALTYSSGAPNSPYGLGWALSVPGVRRKTSGGVPRYDGTDVFVLSGAEDLVPVPPGPGVPAGQAYRPRVEGLYARIVRHTGGGQDYWEVWSANGEKSRYGTYRPDGAPDGWRDPAAVTDPANPSHVFEWLLSETVDTCGNRIVHDYARDPGGYGRLYLSSIRYVDHGDPVDPDYLVRIALRYEARPDPFVDRRAGFAISTTQRCVAVETYLCHADPPVRTRTVHLTYTRAPGNGVSLLSRVTVEGHDGARTQQLPPLELSYTAFAPERRRFQLVDAVGGELPAAALGGPDVDLVDLFGNGLPSVVQLNGAARYWANLGDGRLVGPKLMRYAPTGVSLTDPGVLIADADGDGRPDLVTSGAQTAGYFPLEPTGGFDERGFAAWAVAPPFALNDPLVKLVDLDGDGVTDAIRSGESFELYFNDKVRGWWRSERRPRTSPYVPDVTFDDPRVKLADLSGDGLIDIALVHDRRLEYWPALGDGRFGQKVDMTNAPHFPDAAAYGATGYDPRRVLIGDLDGDSCADVAYVGDGFVMVWINQGGLSFAPPVTIRGTPSVTDADAIRLTDLLGTGTAGVLWSRDAGGGAGTRGGRYRFLDLTGGVKPYLLNGIDNHAGARTRISYASSTKYWLADRRGGRPWRTTLPFPVQVVAELTVQDVFSRTSITSEFRYHHGYWDGAEREFRGFGRVDQHDMRLGVASGDSRTAAPTQTRTWFCLGPVGPEFGAWTTLNLADEYWRGDPPRLGGVVLDLPAGLPRRALRDAIRALRGKVLRTETYALDGDPSHGAHPYAVTEHRERVSAVLDGRPAAPLDPGWAATPVFVAQTVATRSTQWERGDEPRHNFTWTDGHDAYGRPRRRGEGGVPRGQDPALPTGAAGDPFLVTATLLDYATRDDPDRYVTQRVAATTRLEVPDDGAHALADIWAGVVDGTAQTQLIGHEATCYDGEPFTGLPLGQLGDRALATRVERLVHTPASLAAAYRAGDAPDTSPQLPPQLTGGPWPAEYPAAYSDGAPALGGYVRRGGDGFNDGWYAYGPRKRHGPRGQVLAERDALGNETAVKLDDYDLLPVVVIDPAGLTTTATYDYRVLKAAEAQDANGNRTAYAYTPLGLVESIAVMGKLGEEAGDTPEQPGTVYEYGLTAFDDSPPDAPEPIWVHTTKRTLFRWQIVDDERERRRKAGLPPLTDADIVALFPNGEREEYPERFVQTREYSDGFGRLLQTRAQAAALTCDDVGLPGSIGGKPGDAVLAENPGGAAMRTVVSGWQTYDEKGHVLERYEPYLDDGWEYAPPSQEALDKALARTTTLYDPLGRPVHTVYPDGAREDFVYGIPADLTNPSAYTPTPWETYSYDRGDNGGRTHPDRSAAYSSHWNTPSSTVVDALGRTVAHTERIDGRELTSLTTYDARGNVRTVTDPLGRAASRADYDFADRCWRTELLDAGVHRSVHDPTGAVVEERDARGVLLLTMVDALQRPTVRYARADAGAPMRVSEMFVYGDEGSAADRATAAAANLLGRVSRVRDGAGELAYLGYDLLGGPAVTRRHVPTLDALTAGLPAGGGDWSHVGPPLDWSGGGPDLDPATYETAIRSDALGRRLAVTCPADVTGGRATIAASYDPVGRVTALAVDDQVYIDAAIYNARGQRTLVRHGDAALVRRAYDPVTGRLLRTRAERSTIVAPLHFRGTGGPQSDIAHDYDLVGNLTATNNRTPGCGVSPTPDALDRQFSYDALYRLVLATGRECDVAPATPPWELFARCTDVTRARPYTEAYSYDDAGNVTKLTHGAGPSFPGSTTVRTYALTPGVNRLASMTTGSLTYTYSYDGAGNLSVEETDRRFEYDAASRMVTFRRQSDTAQPSVYAQYLYDITGARVAALVRTQDGALRMRVTIGEFFERLITRTPAGQESSYDTIEVTDGAVRVGRRRIGSAAPDDPLPAVTVALTDHLGSVVAQLDATGQTLAAEEFTPFGETSFGGYATKRYRFTGKERDAETGLAYHGARYYAAYLGRWTSCDPAGHADGWCPYAYCRDRPTAFADPTGRQAAPAYLPDPFLSPPAPPRPPLRLLPPPTGPPTVPWYLTPVNPALGYVLAGVAVAGSAVLVGFTIDAAVKGEPTPIDVADKFYGTHFGDIYGWVTGQYAKKPAAGLVASSRDDAKERREFRQWAVSRIMDGCNGKVHPLRNILDAQGKPYNAASKASEMPIWDAGHLKSAHGGGRAMGMEDSSFNREEGFTDERQGVVFVKQHIDICGVSVELRTAQRWESAGLIPAGTVASSPVSGGWMPPAAAAAMTAGGAATMLADPDISATAPTFQDAKPPVLQAPPQRLSNAPGRHQDIPPPRLYLRSRSTR
jgi:RHS repeat-associated protein